MHLCKMMLSNLKLIHEKLAQLKLGDFSAKKASKKEIKGYKNDQVSLHYGAY